MSGLCADILVGPTASGKSAVALHLALQARPPRPILSADSMTVYRGMDLGTAKPDAAERAAVPSFGFDLADPGQPFSVGDYLAAIRAGPTACSCVPNCRRPSACLKTRCHPKSCRRTGNSRA